MPERMPSTPVISCPYCGQSREHGHGPECPIGQAIPEIVQVAAYEEAMEIRGERAGGAVLDAIAGAFDRHGALAASEYATAIADVARRAPDTIVRREDLHVLFPVLRANVPLRLRFGADVLGDTTPYPNAARLGSGAEGLRIPFGYGFSKVHTGATQVIIGFDSEGLVVQLLPDGQFEQFRAADRALVRMVEGDVPIDHLRFAIVRLVRRFFPEERMTDRELEQEQMLHVFRLFEFPK